MSLGYLKLIVTSSVFVAIAACAATTPTSDGDSNFVDTLLQGPTCNYGDDLTSLEAIKDQIVNSADKQSSLLERKDKISALIAKTENLAGSSRPEDALGCRFLEMEARVLLVELPSPDGAGDTYTSAHAAIQDVKTLCATTNDARMCSAARLHDATIYARRSASELERIGSQDQSVPIDWTTTLSLTQAFEEHVRETWPTYLETNESSEDVTSNAIERSLLASACVADRGMTSINRRVGLSVNKDTEGKLVPYSKHSGQLLAQMTKSLDLSPGDSCYANPNERTCRGSLANKMHLVCLRAGESVVQ